MLKRTEECQHAFDLLKHKLTSAPVLAHPDYPLPFILDTDASDVGIGAVLSLRHPDGKEYTIVEHLPNQKGDTPSLAENFLK